MKNSERIENPSIFAFLMGNETVVNYDEAVDVEDLIAHPEWEQNALSRRNFIGEGYICGYDIFGNIWTSEKLSKLYVNRSK